MATLTSFKKLLSTKTASILCFIIGLLEKILLLRAFLTIENDRATLILTAKNFLAGHGFSLDRTFISDLSIKQYIIHNGSPPGYALLVSIFLEVFPGNFMLATYLVDVLAAIILFIYLRKILLLLQWPAWLINIFLIFQGVFINDYIISARPTDFISLSLLVAGIYHCSKVYLQNKAINNALAAAFFFSCAALMRYQNMPVCIAVSLVVLAVALRTHKKLLYPALTLLGIEILIFGGVLLFQKVYSGSYVFLQPAQKGFFPLNVLDMYPFALESFLNFDFYSIQLSLLFKNGYRHWMDVSAIMGWIIFLALTPVYIYYLFKHKNKTTRISGLFWLYASTAAAITVALLVILSVTNSKTGMKPYPDWTYVMNGRYFALPVTFIQLAAWHYLFAKPIRNAIQKWLKWLLIVIVFAETLHGIYFLAKKFTKPVLPFDQILWKQPEMNFAKQFIDEQKKRDPSRQIVVASADGQFPSVANWYGASGMYTPLDINKASLQTTKPVVLLAVIRKNELFLFDRFLKQPGVSLVNIVGNDYHYYTLYIEPAATHR